jgi:hypothetical protein
LTAHRDAKWIYIIPHAERHLEQRHIAARYVVLFSRFISLIETAMAKAGGRKFTSQVVATFH